MTTGTDGPARSVEVRRGRIQVALSAVAVLVVAGGVLLAVRTGGSGDPPAAGSAGAPPTELTIRGRTVQRGCC